MYTYIYTLHVLFKRRTAIGIKEFSKLFVLQMGHLRRRLDGRVVNSWFKIWSFFVKIERAFRKLCCSQKRARSLWGTAVILEAIGTILRRLFLFFTPKLWNFQSSRNSIVRRRLTKSVHERHIKSLHPRKIGREDLVSILGRHLASTCIMLLRQSQSQRDSNESHNEPHFSHVVVSYICSII